jgi:ribosomal protein S18 acetylase RimI-like enzyme
MIKKIEKEKERYFALLLIADEQKNMIDKYIDGDMFVIEEKGLIKACCIVKIVSKDTIEIKNISVLPAYQRKGFGRQLIEYVSNYYADIYSFLIVGTGDSPLTIPFYEKCGFSKYRLIKNFFTDNYDHRIFEGGKQLVDMIYLKKKIHE